MLTDANLDYSQAIVGNHRIPQFGGDFQTYEVDDDAGGIVKAVKFDVGIAAEL
jgi:hypothetical protein